MLGRHCKFSGSVKWFTLALSSTIPSKFPGLLRTYRGLFVCPSEAAPCGMLHAAEAAGSSRCSLHACAGFQPREALIGLAYSTCGATKVALVSVQPSLNTSLHLDLAVRLPGHHPSCKSTMSNLH